MVWQWNSRVKAVPRRKVDPVKRATPVLHRNDPDKGPLIGHVKVTREDWLRVANDVALLELRRPIKSGGIRPFKTADSAQQGERGSPGRPQGHSRGQVVGAVRPESGSHRDERSCRRASGEDQGTRRHVGAMERRVGRKVIATRNIVGAFHGIER